VERDELGELHYITHVDNLESICRRGILSHRLARRIKHRSVADPEVQDRRKGKRVPGGLLLHDYANLYMTARNPMLYKTARAEERADELCVLQISPAVLDLPEVVVSDMNAASPYARFYAADEGLDHVDSDRVFRHYWTDGDLRERELCKKAKCAEVLVPMSVAPEHLIGVCVGTKQASASVNALQHDLPLGEDPEFFFNP
jgi:ssDNA thymidine ADP-ribosyltransferase, DarT